LNRREKREKREEGREKTEGEPKLTDGGIFSNIPLVCSNIPKTTFLLHAAFPKILASFESIFCDHYNYAIFNSNNEMDIEKI